MSSGSLVELQCTVIGPPKRRADPNQRTVRTVVRPTKSVVNRDGTTTQTYRCTPESCAGASLVPQASTQ